MVTITTQPDRKRQTNPILKFIGKVPWTWVITFVYLSFLLILPIIAMIVKASQEPFEKFWATATSPIALSSYEVTFVTAFAAAAVNGIFGTLIAWVIVRYNFWGKRFVEAVVDLPFALPTAVAGLTLATMYSNKGFIGAYFAPFGIKIAFSRIGVFIAMTFISLPFIVRTVQPVLNELEKEIEEAAWSLGASQFQTFFQVILPPLTPSILTGVALGFSRAVGEYGSTVIIASNTPFRDLITPVLIFQRLEQYDYVGATVIGVVMLAISFVSLLAINLLQAWSKRYG
ncbi:MAG: sulfate ABC transporter permease subunit CysT [Pseudanabaena sp.]|jgi:sulfate transport system permease protein|uniref:sulfate ABC transporter permease subunit CysT n=1 Tax=Pseudanabaena mucicola TaxID=71190 RepID=UPI00257570EA|nr:sulfate ABC transporter permease subunit CysT [Pseudanabaena mucicola]MCA6575036.1 sulfate ABC transporter permease subunit CysT [Pseudanabaena sp. M53BS1SP1A06MG]MCA6584253.1 sulfate ABC transporter permease subunit CysT [Pseudanabaena sp. M34BS1SP1A06MG]MCA6588738.1 sulfate ABC transporter permease subunit CysT [Pseudanabaena sp. M109S1SP1A06QC]MCA6592951.1 sulfate ABC transporter permease subunit CysT [Pseudanabaena sp. M38BS1SP1A06MG]MCA6600737.1 sulfate ABC transporter permease subunit